MNYSRQLSIGRRHIWHFNMPDVLSLGAGRRIALFNISLALLLLVLLVWYLFTANQIVAQNYKIGYLKSEINESTAKLAELKEQSGVRLSVNELADFARRNGMVEAGSHDVLFTDTGLAKN